MTSMTTLEVDFAGTREEAREFVAANNSVRPALHLGNGKRGNEGLPTLTMRCTSRAKVQVGYAALAALGFDKEFVGATKRSWAC